MAEKKGGGGGEIGDGGVLRIRLQVILDNLLSRQGSTPK